MPDETSETPAPLPQSVGATLRHARNQTGKSLAEVATMLRIRQPYLLALEEGRHKDLPGGAYAIGFLRTYADFLDLDGEEMLRRFRAEASGDLHPRSELVFPSPVSEGRIPGGAVLFVGLLLAGISYGGWYLLSSRDTSMAEMVPALPDRLTSVLNRPATVTAEPKPAKNTQEPVKLAEPVGQNPTKETEVVPPVEDEEVKPKAVEPAPAPVKGVAPKPVEPVKVEAPKPVEPVKVEAPKPVEPAKVEAPKPVAVKVETPKPVEPVKVEAPKPEAAKSTVDHGDSRVVLTAASDDCWIQVREMDGQLLMSRLLRKGDSYAVPNRPGLTLMVGNAGALDVAVDGKKAPTLGTSGQVRRDIRLDPDKLTGS
ncbi:MAG: hypothetical protein FD119_1370 [Stygiobacter sp.]|nr:MAG: hypothetical protein FD119_1370 [Stygiobacter sp.]